MKNSSDDATTYTVRPVSFETMPRKPAKKISKSSKIFLFKVIAINCNILVSVIFQLMHCSRKISNRNSLQFCRYRCLNVTYGCILMPLQLHFQLRKRKIVGWTQIRRVRPMVKSFVGTMCCSRCSAVNACGTNCAYSFRIFIIGQNAVNNCFWYPSTLCYHPTTSVEVVFQNSCHTSNVFVCFCCSHLSAPLCIFS